MRARCAGVISSRPSSSRMAEPLRIRPFMRLPTLGAMRLGTCAVAAGHEHAQRIVVVGFAPIDFGQMQEQRQPIDGAEFCRGLLVEMDARESESTAWSALCPIDPARPGAGCCAMPPRRAPA